MSLYVDIKKKLDDFSLSVCFEAKDEIFAVLGESGCGKSLTLKCIAGIETPDEGKIVLNGKVLFDSQKKINIPARKRNVGYLFQDYALFPNMTVAENIGISIERAVRKEKVEEYIKLFFLEGLGEKYPYMLSGGQKQRTALARMMAQNPEIILLDEPFSSVDSYLKWKLEQQIAELFERYQKTILFVSHNRDEVYRLCSRMGIIHNGKMREIGEKHEIFKNPQTISAAILTGCKNISGVSYINRETIVFDSWKIQKEIPDVWKEKRFTSVGIRAHDIEVVSEQEADAKCILERLIESPFDMIYLLRVPGAEKGMRLEISKNQSLCYKEGQELYIRLPVEKLLFLKE